MEFVVIIAVVLGAAIFLMVEGSMPSSTVEKIAVAIARAEGFYVTGSIPQRAKNPGDLERGDIGYGTISGKTVYPDILSGWNALYAQIRGMLDGSSAIYGPDWTIQDVANMYVSGQDTPTPDSTAWANNVASTLGVTTDTPIGQVS